MPSAMLLVDLDTPSATPVYRVASALVYNVNSGSVDTVIVDGKVLRRGKEVLVVDEKVLLAEARAACVRLFERGDQEVARAALAGCFPARYPCGAVDPCAGLPI